MDSLPDSWNDLLDWLYSKPMAEMSHAMRAARQVTLFHGEVCNGGLYDKLAYRNDEYPHADLVSSFERICGNPTAAIIRDGLKLLELPCPSAKLPDDARGAFFVSVDSVSRGANLDQTLEHIESVFPECPENLRVIAYETAVANARHFVPWEALDKRYFEIGDGVLMDVATYADAFKAEWK